MFLIFGNLDFTTTMTLAPSIDGYLLNILTLFLLIGAMAKSAQIGLLKADSEAVQSCYMRGNPHTNRSNIEDVLCVRTRSIEQRSCLIDPKAPPNRRFVQLRRAGG